MSESRRKEPLQSQELSANRQGIEEGEEVIGNGGKEKGGTDKEKGKEHDRK
jgi:hypothetical protein